ncbi:ribosomal protein L7/L12 [Paenibacillus kyungheensis]
MNTYEIVAIIALVLSVLLLLRVISLQSQLNEMKSDLEWLKNRPGNGGLTPTHRLKPLSSSTGAPEHTSVPSTIDQASFEERILFLTHENKKIQAIKEVREVRGWGLKEAKDYVDQLENEYKQKNL